MTIKDIAKESGYSVGTVSRVLNNSPSVSEAARKRVMEYLFNLGHEKIDILGGASLASRTVSMRCEGIREAFAERGLSGS